MEMKPLATAELVLTWLCLYPPDPNASIWKRKAYIGFTSVIITVQAVGITAGIVFVTKFISVELEKCLFVSFVIFCHACTVYMALVAFLLRKQIPKIFWDLSEIYKEYKYDDSFPILAQSNEKSEWTWKFYFKWIYSMFCGSYIFAGVTSVLSCLYKYGKFDHEQLYVPYSLILPWNQTTPIGYFGEIGLSTWFAGCYFFMNGVVFLLFISMCLHHQAFYRMLKHSLKAFDYPNEKRNDKRMLCKLIRFHNTVRDWFSLSAQIYQLFLFVEIVSSMLLLSISLLSLDQQLRNIDFGFFIYMLALFTGLSNLFLYCFFGKFATHNFEKMIRCLYEFNWMHLSIDLQKYVILMIINAQKPLFYHGFGIITLNLETFTKVMKAAFTYYMVFKTVTI